MKHIVIVGLRRSGTTIFWQTLSQNPHFTGFDEPFSPLITPNPKPHKKGTRESLIALHAAAPTRFENYYAPIQRSQEFDSDLTPRQARYLSYLFGVGPTVIDTTRCITKLRALAELDEEFLLVHLFRRASQFVESHLMPSDHFDFLSIRKIYRQKRLFKMNTGFNRWGMEDLLSEPLLNLTRAQARTVGVRLNPDAPACEKLLALWLMAKRLVSRDGGLYHRDSFQEISFEKFCHSPMETLSTVSELADGSYFQYDLSDIQTGSLRQGEPNSMWYELAERVGFVDEEYQYL